MTAAVTVDKCFRTETRITCYGVPSQIPRTVQEIFLHDINIQTDTLTFDSHVWKNITLLDIKSVSGKHFKGLHKPIFNSLSNLRSLGLHCVQLDYLHSKTFLGLSNLESLDLSYSKNLKLDEVKKVFELNSSIPNLKTLKLSFINNFPVRIDNVFSNNLGKRPIETLDLQGLTLIKASKLNLLPLSHSLVNLNLSNVIYFSNKDKEGNDGANISFSRLTTAGISGTPRWDWSFTFLQSYIGTNVRHIYLDLKAFPSLTNLYADNLPMDIPGFAIIETGCYYKCSRCRNLENLKKLYLRRNKLQWFNATCDDCYKLKLESIDISGNGLEYINPGFFRTITTLESINFNDNKLYVMEHFTDFKNLFITFTRLRVLKMSVNRLAYMPMNIFKNNIKLEDIDLSNNLLTSLELSLTHLYKLKSLDISNNRIHVLRQQDFVYFSTLLDLRNYTFALHLSGNTFTCDCESSRFIKWMYVYRLPRVPQNTPIRCILGGENVPIDNQALLASQHSCERNGIILVSALLSFTLLGVIVTLGVLLKRFLKRKLQQEKRQEYIAGFLNDRILIKYIVFLVFCTKNEELIRNYVYPVLTDSFKKLLGVDDKVICDGVNEYRLGLTIVSETERCIRQSSVVVFVCSNASCECLRCRREINIACDKDKPIATIILDDLPDDLPTALLEAVLEKSMKAHLVFEDNGYALKPTALKFCKFVLDLASVK